MESSDEGGQASQSGAARIQSLGPLSLSFETLLTVPAEVWVTVRSKPEVQCLIECKEHGVLLDHYLHHYALLLYTQRVHTSSFRAIHELEPPHRWEANAALPMMEQTAGVCVRPLARCKDGIRKSLTTLETLLARLRQFAEINRSMAADLSAEGHHVEQLARTKLQIAETQELLAHRIGIMLGREHRDARDDALAASLLTGLSAMFQASSTEAGAAPLASASFGGIAGIDPRPSGDAPGGGAGLKETSHKGHTIGAAGAAASAAAAAGATVASKTTVAIHVGAASSESTELTGTRAVGAAPAAPLGSPLRAAYSPSLLKSSGESAHNAVQEIPCSIAGAHGAVHVSAAGPSLQHMTSPGSTPCSTPPRSGVRASPGAPHTPRTTSAAIPPPAAATTTTAGTTTTTATAATTAAAASEALSPAHARVGSKRSHEGTPSQERRGLDGDGDYPGAANGASGDGGDERGRRHMEEDEDEEERASSSAGTGHSSQSPWKRPRWVTQGGTRGGSSSGGITPGQGAMAHRDEGGEDILEEQECEEDRPDLGHGMHVEMDDEQNGQRQGEDEQGEDNGYADEHNHEPVVVQREEVAGGEAGMGMGMEVDMEIDMEIEVDEHDPELGIPDTPERVRGTAAGASQAMQQRDALRQSQQQQQQHSQKQQQQQHSQQQRQSQKQSQKDGLLPTPHLPLGMGRVEENTEESDEARQLHPSPVVGGVEGAPHPLSPHHADESVLLLPQGRRRYEEQPSFLGAPSNAVVGDDDLDANSQPCSSVEASPRAANSGRPPVGLLSSLLSQPDPRTPLTTGGTVTPAGSSFGSSVASSRGKGLLATPAFIPETVLVPRRARSVFEHEKRT